MTTSPLQTALMRNIKDVVIFMGIFGLLALGMLWILDQQRYDWQWFRLWRYIYVEHDGQYYAGPLLRGLFTTLEISAYAIVISAIGGFVIAMMRASKLITARAIARIYIEVVRNIPILVLLFLIYFVLAPVFGLNRFWAGVATLAIYEAAFAAEIYRSGIEAVPNGQKEAAKSIGLRPLQVMFYVTIPQSVPFILPAMTNLMINLVKHSAIVSVIAIFDLTNEGRNVIAETFMVFEVWFAVAGIYLVVTTILSILASMVETRTKRFYAR